MHFEIDDREANQRPRLGSFAQALLDRGNIFLGDVAALDLVEKLEPRTAFARDDVDLDLTELTRTTRLLLVGVGEVNRLREILAISDLWSADIGLDLELTLHAVDEDLEVELAHPLDDGLTRFMVGGHPD